MSDACHTEQEYPQDGGGGDHGKIADVLFDELKKKC